MKFCQSCGMPLQAEDQWGMNADGSLNEKIVVIVIKKVLLPRITPWRK